MCFFRLFELYAYFVRLDQSAPPPTSMHHMTDLLRCSIEKSLTENGWWLVRERKRLCIAFPVEVEAIFCERPLRVRRAGCAVPLTVDHVRALLAHGIEGLSAILRHEMTKATVTSADTDLRESRMYQRLESLETKLYRELAHSRLDIETDPSLLDHPDALPLYMQAATEASLPASGPVESAKTASKLDGFLLQTIYGLVGESLDALGSEELRFWVERVRRQLVVSLTLPFSLEIDVQAHDTAPLVLDLPVTLRLDAEFDPIVAPVAFVDEAAYREAILAWAREKCAKASRQLQRVADRLFQDHHERIGLSLDLAPLRKRLARVRGGRPLSHTVADIRATITLWIKNEMRNARETLAVARVREQIDFSRYSDYFPLARGINRQITLFVGPTNSGKTHAAFNMLSSYSTGAYYAPLRLLALEGQEQLRDRGVRCSFLTGEERDLDPSAAFMSCTVEMADLSRPVDAVVIDEVQMLADPCRGWAWTRVLVGAPAEHVIVTGTPAVVKILERVASSLQEKFEVHALDRLSPLFVKEKPDRLEDAPQWPVGTAVVCFSRRDVLGIKSVLEEEGRTVAVIYGGLGPDVRRSEARRFRSGEAEILVATDAIAMGLNLPISQVLFWRTTKWNGQEDRVLADEEVRQIAGRAGRFGIKEEGYVGAFSKESLRIVRPPLSRIDPPFPGPIPVKPDANQVETIGKALETDSLPAILKFFQEKLVDPSSDYHPADLNDMFTLAGVIDDMEIRLRDKFVFATAPVNTRSETLLNVIEDWASLHAQKLPVGLPVLRDVYAEEATSSDIELRQAEELVHYLTVYAWLAYRYPETFVELDVCEDQRDLVNGYIERSLQAQRMRRLCTRCNARIDELSRYSICEACYRRQSGGGKDPGAFQAKRSGNRGQRRRSK